MVGKRLHGSSRRSAESGVGILLVAGLVTAIGIGVAALIPDQVSLEAQKIKETQRRMAMIRDAVYTHRSISLVLAVPCPTSGLNTVLTSATPPVSAACVASGVRQGGVPTKTLGLADEYALDAWGNKFRYVVNGAHTDTVADFNNTEIVVTGNGYAPRMSNGQLFYAAGTGQVPIALIISSGADGAGAFNRNGSPAPDPYDLSTRNTSLQYENNDNDAVFFVDVAFPEYPDGKNDDLVEGVFTYKNCEEPVVCSASGAMGNLPVGCITALGYNVRTIGHGERVHTATRIATCGSGATRTIQCNDGTWTGATC